LDKTVGRNPAKTDRYIIQISQRAIPKLVNKDVRIVLHDNEAIHTIPDNALGMPVYEFEVNFSNDDDFNDSVGLSGADEYPFGGDASDT
jgi:hypothetical protein